MSSFRSSVTAKDGDETITGFDKFQGDEVVCGTLTATKINVKKTINADTIKCATVTATYVKANTKIQIAAAKGYLKLGTQQYIFFGNKGVAASIVASVTAIQATPLIGSVYLSRRKPKARIFYFVTDVLASPVNLD